MMSCCLVAQPLSTVQCQGGYEGRVMGGAQDRGPSSEFVPVNGRRVSWPEAQEVQHMGPAAPSTHQLGHFLRANIHNLD